MIFKNAQTEAKWLSDIIPLSFARLKWMIYQVVAFCVNWYFTILFYYVCHLSITLNVRFYELSLNWINTNKFLWQMCSLHFMCVLWVCTSPWSYFQMRSCSFFIEMFYLSYNFSISCVFILHLKSSEDP